MKATKDHISLETCKLLKDCGVDTIWLWEKFYNPLNNEYNWVVTYLSTQNTCYTEDVLPCYSWKTILKYSSTFFGKDSQAIASKELLMLLDSRYEEADEYFRKHCILIPQPTNE